MKSAKWAIRRMQNTLAKFPRAILAHTPTPLEKLPRLSAEFPPCHLYVKRDDCTGLALGGNKARQLEFHLGEALAKRCDNVLSTGALQSNHLRMLAAAAAKLGLECHLQLEDRVDNRSPDYRHSGNILLDRLLGAHLHHRPNAGEDEDGADAALTALAEKIAERGKPYIIPLGAAHPPIGALGYVAAAVELARQMQRADLPIDLLAVASGSGLTHAGLLTGLRAMGLALPVVGVCVRRSAELQHPRVLAHCRNLADMLGRPGVVQAADVWVEDAALAPGYGRASRQVLADVRLLAAHCGLLTDPVYSGKTFHWMLGALRTGDLNRFRHIAVIHTGGTPALFAYRADMLNGAAQPASRKSPCAI